MKSCIVLFWSFALAFAAETDLKEFAATSRQFSGAVYDEILVNNNGNILVSPFSVETILALTQSGAGGTTGEEIRASLFLPETKEETEALIKSVLPSFKDDDYKLHTANKIYVENGFAVKEDFKKVASDVYEAAFESIEFADSGDAVEEINKWVEEETENKIKDLLNPGDVDASTKVVLINALYFQGNWTVPFEERSTKKALFYISSDETVHTQQMYQEAQLYNFYESPELDAQFLELPFVGQDASMTIILPNKKEGIAILEKQMSTVLVKPEYSKEIVEVSLPKFKIESTIDFQGILEKLGVRAAFNPTQVDFSGIAGEPGDIIINQIKQKTFIDVNEGGVEAAAATSIVVGPTSVLPPPASRKFIVDHPFAFYIKVNDIILFEGRVLEPKY